MGEVSAFYCKLTADQVTKNAITYYASASSERASNVARPYFTTMVMLCKLYATVVN